MSDVTNWLKQHAAFRDDQLPQPGWKYSSYEALLLDRGRDFTRVDLPSLLDLGEPKQCYSNATHALIAWNRYGLYEDTPLYYCEGFAPSVFPVQHAFLVAEDGRAFDNTWDVTLLDNTLRDPLYFGIAYDTDWYFDHIEQTGEYGVFGGELYPAEFLRHGLPNTAIADWMRAA